jgi:hypothetical protein
VFFMHSASAVDIYRAQRKHINYSIWPMRISRHDLRRRYSNSLVIDAGSQFSLRACSQATRVLDWLAIDLHKRAQKHFNLIMIDIIHTISEIGKLI